MRKKGLVILIALLAVTALLAVWNIHMNKAVPEDSIALLYNGSTSYIKVADIKKEDQSVHLVNGKGEEVIVEGKGIALSELLEGYTYSSAKVVASDEFYATVSKEECDHAYLIVNSNNDLQLAVFGDKNSKRAVKKPVRIELE